MRHTIEEKLRIVEETRAKGASVAMVARRHNINANQVFAWRRQHRRGLLNSQDAKDDAKLLPVKVSTPTVLRNVLERIADHPINKIEELLPLESPPEDAGAARRSLIGCLWPRLTI